MTATLLAIAEVAVVFGGERAVAVVTALDGSVTIDGKPASLLQSVAVGARVQTREQGSRIVLSYVRGGARVTVWGGQALTVAADPRPEAGNLRVQVTRPAVPASSSLPESVNMQRIGGGRPLPVLLLLVGGSMDMDQPFEWRSRSACAEFAVSLDGPGLTPTFRDSVAAVVERVVADASENLWDVYTYRLPPAVRSALKPGVEYTLRVTASETRGGAGLTVSSRFRVADPAVLAALTRAIAARDHDADSETLAVEQAALYMANDMLFAAWRGVEALKMRKSAHVRALLEQFEALASERQMRAEAP